jgi:hypothetical protein
LATNAIKMATSEFQQVTRNLFKNLGEREEGVGGETGEEAKGREREEEKRG